MKIYCVGYRSWALDIYKALKKKTKHRFKIHSQKKRISIRDIKQEVNDAVNDTDESVK